MTRPDTSLLRREWERQWGRQDDDQFDWSLGSDVAPQLRAVLDERPEWSGRALDVGCGAGASTAYLAGVFDVAFGIDLAVAAVQRAVARHAPPRPPFVPADALQLPFASRCFSLVFDRGCLQNLPRAAWPMYFTEIERVLADGGVLVLLVSRLEARFPSLFSRRGVRARWAWYVQRRRGGAQFVSHDLIRRLCPPSLHIQQLSDFDFVTKKGKARTFTYVVATKGSR